MSESDPDQTDDKHPASMRSGSAPNNSGLWVFYVWIGTSLAGTLFGLLLGLFLGAVGGFSGVISGTFFGIMVGYLYSGVVSAPVILLAAAANWAIGSTRCRTLLAVFAGGATGTLCIVPFALLEKFPIPDTVLFVMGVFAAFLGSAGARLGEVKWTKLTKRQGRDVDTPATKAEIPDACRSFHPVAFAIIVAVFVAACIGIFGGFNNAREAIHRNHCGDNLKQLACGLHLYESTNHSLPPAYLTGEDGEPVLSWRVAAASYWFYDSDLSELIEDAQPWNSAENANYLDHSFAFAFHCPSSGKRRDNPLTDYVAVIGPNTLWPGKEPGETKKNPRGILIVEWPRSDIHWAEPRDVTVDEFLDLFRRKPPRRGFFDWLFARPIEGYTFHTDRLLYVDAEGNVGELRLDTDPETVRKMLTGQSPSADDTSASGEK